MIYEQRVYRATPGRLPDLLARMEHDTLPLWEKHGLRPLGFFTSAEEGLADDLIYLLAWESVTERDERWGAFQADPEWKAKRATSEESGGPLVASIKNTLLTPTAFSRLK